MNAAFEGDSLAERLANVAGFLAERSVTRIELVAGDERHVLGARTTDLPGELACLVERFGRVRIELASPPIVIAIDAARALVTQGVDPDRPA